MKQISGLLILIVMLTTGCQSSSPGPDAGSGTVTAPEPSPLPGPSPGPSPTPADVCDFEYPALAHVGYKNLTALVTGHAALQTLFSISLPWESTAAYMTSKHSDPSNVNTILVSDELIRKLQELETPNVELEAQTKQLVYRIAYVFKANRLFRNAQLIENFYGRFDELVSDGYKFFRMQRPSYYAPMDARQFLQDREIARNELKKEILILEQQIECAKKNSPVDKVDIAGLDATRKTTETFAGVIAIKSMEIQYLTGELSFDEYKDLSLSLVESAIALPRKGFLWTSFSRTEESLQKRLKDLASAP